LNTVGKNRKSGKRPKQKRNRGANPTICPPGADVYRGAVVPRALNNSAVQVEDRIFTQPIPVSSNGSGNIQFSVSTNPNSSSEWSTYSARYIEFRVLAMRCRYIPNFQNFANTAALAYSMGPLFGGICRNATLALPASAAASLSEGMKVATIQRPMQLDWKMSGTPEANWQNTATPAATGYVYLTAFGLSASTLYGNAMVWYLVQFRNRS